MTRNFPKKEERLDALGHVLLLAALVYMDLQYKMRQAREPFDRPPRGLMTHPTSREALQHLSHAMIVRIEDGPRRIQIPSDCKNGFQQILRWTGVDPSVYVVPHVRSARREIKPEEDRLLPGRNERTSDPRRPPPPRAGGTPQTKGGKSDPLT